MDLTSVALVVSALSGLLAFVAVMLIGLRSSRVVDSCALQAVLFIVAVVAATASFLIGYWLFAAWSIMQSGY